MNADRAAGPILLQRPAPEGLCAGTRIVRAVGDRARAERPLGRCEGEPEVRGLPGSVDDLLRNIFGLAPVAELDEHERGCLVSRVAEIKRKR